MNCRGETIPWKIGMMEKMFYCETSTKKVFTASKALKKLTNP